MSNSWPPGRSVMCPTARYDLSPNVCKQKMRAVHTVVVANKAWFILTKIQPQEKKNQTINFKYNHKMFQSSTQNRGDLN